MTTGTRPELDRPVGLERRRGLRPVPVDVVTRAGLGVVAIGVLASAVTGTPSATLAAAVVVGGAGACYLATFASPAWLISIGLALTVFSGNSDRLGLPIGPDRILIAAGLGALALSTPGVTRTRVIVWRPLHAALAGVTAIATVSAFAAGTLLTADGFFALLDRLGIIPFVVFTLSPLIFGEQRDRDALLTVLVGTGAYLGVTGILEGVGLADLTLPSYVADPAAGIHFGRARGPFVEAVAMGLSLYGCAVASAVAAATWRRPLRRVVAQVSCLACVAATVFTLTRAVWLATVVATAMALLVTARTRRVLVVAGAAGTAALVGALLFLPGFAGAVSERSNDQRPLWDRYNTNRAAVEMILAEPLTGIGWQAFEDRAPEFLHIARDYPLTGVGIPVHNVPLSNAAELGLPGALLWAVALVFAAGGAILRRGPSVLDPWRLGMVALFLHWLIVASFGPLAYAFPNLLLWTWAGVCSLGHLSAPAEPR